MGFLWGWGLGSRLDWQGLHLSVLLHLEGSPRGGTLFSSYVLYYIHDLKDNISPGAEETRLVP